MKYMPLLLSSILSPLYTYANNPHISYTGLHKNISAFVTTHKKGTIIHEKVDTALKNIDPRILDTYSTSEWHNCYEYNADRECTRHFAHYQAKIPNKLLVGLLAYALQECSNQCIMCEKCHNPDCTEHKDISYFIPRSHLWHNRGKNNLSCNVLWEINNNHAKVLTQKIDMPNTLSEQEQSFILPFLHYLQNESLKRRFPEVKTS